MSIFKFNTFPFLRRHYWKGETGSQLRFTSTDSTITPALTVSGGPTPLWYVTESTGQVFKYAAASFSHTKTAGTGNLTVRLVNTETVKNFVTEIDFRNDGLSNSIDTLQLPKLNNLTVVYLSNCTNLTGDFISQYINIINCSGLLLPSTGLSGDYTGINLSNISSNFNIRTNANFTGSLASTQINSNLLTFYGYSCKFTAGPRIPISAISLQQYQIQDNNLLQAAVDQICLDAYNNRTNFTYATPTFNVGGTNAAPSGVYQNATPPTTGKEYIYKLVNDPDLEGFNKQVWTYTA